LQEQLPAGKMSVVKELLTAYRCAELPLAATAAWCCSCVHTTLHASCCFTGRHLPQDNYQGGGVKWLFSSLNGALQATVCQRCKRPARRVHPY
jgi:hypothetical protein